MMLTPEHADAAAGGAGSSFATRAGWTVAAIAAVSLAVRVYFAATLDVFQDEAIYWWQAYAGISFTPHPPMVPVLIRLSSWAFGHGVLSLRLASLACGTGSIVLAYVLGRDLYGRRAGVWAAALLACCPLLLGAGIMATPDAPLVFFWLLFVWVAWRATEGAGRPWGLWLVAGVVLAVGLYTKYMMVLAVPCLLAGLWFSPDKRSQLRRPGPWVACVVGAGLFLPAFLAWNWAHDWPSVAYHLSQRHTWVFQPMRALVYLGEHAGLYSPVLYGAVLAALVAGWRARKRVGARAVWPLVFGAGPVLFFVIPEVFTQEQLSRVQWDETGYAAGLVLLAGMAFVSVSDRARLWWRRVCVAGLAVALLVLAFGAALELVPGLARSLNARVPSRQTEGWSSLAERFREVTGDRRPVIVADSFREAVCLGFCLNRRDGIYTLANRRNEKYGLAEQLSEWGIDRQHLEEELGRQDAVYVKRKAYGHEPNPKTELRQIGGLFPRVEHIEVVNVKRAGMKLWSFHLYRCSGR